MLEDREKREGKGKVVVVVVGQQDAPACIH